MVARSIFAPHVSRTDAIMARRAMYLPWIFLFGYVGWLCWKLRSLLFGEFVVPTGDLAEHDILIVAAKTFSLLHGPFSRVGFAHPGPYYMQIAAFGELLFYDWLRIFSSYYAAQVFASTLMHGVALTLAFRLWLVTTGRGVDALVAVGITIAAIVRFAPDALTSAWLPYCYVASTIMVATGLAGMMLRGPAWLPLYVFGLVQLLHGHASFLGLVPVMVLVAGLAALAHRQLPFSLSRPRQAIAYATSHRWPFIASAAIVGLAALPFIANLILNWPTDFPKYFQFAAQAQPNPAVKVARTILAVLPLYGAWLLVFLFFLWKPETELQCKLRIAATAVFWSGMVPAIFYAFRGIDHLDYSYLLIWVTPSIGTAAALAFLYVSTAIEARLLRWTVAALTAGLVAKPILGVQSVRADSEKSRSIVAAADTLDARTPPGRKTALLLDEFSDTWGELWNDAFTAIAVLHRKGRTPLCLDGRSWPLIRHRCDRDHGRSGTLYVTPHKRTTAPVVARLHHMAVVEPGPVTLGTSLSPTFWLAPYFDLTDGWIRQSRTILSATRRPVIVFDATNLPERFTLKIDGELYATGAGRQTINFYSEEGTKLAEITGTRGHATVTFDVDLTRQADRRTVPIILEVMNPVPLKPEILAGIRLTEMTFLPKR